MSANVNYEYWSPVKVRARFANEYFDQIWNQLSEDISGLREYLKKLSTSGFDYEKLINLSVTEPDREEIRRSARIKTDTGELRIVTNFPAGWLTMELIDAIFDRHRTKWRGAICFPADSFGHRGAPDLLLLGGDGFAGKVCIPGTNYVDPQSLSSTLLKMLTERGITADDLLIDREDAKDFDR